jgi:very-short-patch-repair endonuclease
MTLPEVILWQHIRPGRLDGIVFRRQHGIGPFILDFYCAAARLALEIDGAVHEQPDQAQHDERRTAWLGRQGIRVLRFAAADILKDEGLENILRLIVAEASPSTAAQARRSPSPAMRGRIRRTEP